ncbi:MAG: S8 family serine peptidase [Chloroflexales bacterium]|nr:S8 family serine peptidase [Chloroflexales bacterium]
MKLQHSQRRIITGLVLMGLLTTMLAPLLIQSTQAQNGANPQVIRMDNSPMQVEIQGDTYRVSFDNGATFSRSIEQQTEIKLHARTFDPLEASAQDTAAPVELQAPDSNVYIVQFITQAFESYQQEITQLGGKLYIPVPDQAYIVHMDDATRQQVAQLSYVRWIGPYEPAYKLDLPLSEAIVQAASGEAALAAAEPVAYSIMLFEKGATMQDAVAQRITELGGSVDMRSESSRMEATLSLDQLRQVAQMDEIMFIDLVTETGDDMDIVRQISGANYLERVAGYTGQGVAGEALDRGFNIKHRDFKANPLILHSRNNNPGNTHHGSQVAGILFGNGAGDPKARGLLPDAARPIVASRFSLWGGSGKPNFKQRYAHTRELVDPAGKYRAVFQTNSWGNSRTTRYTTISAEMDEIIFDHDILITQSQSNAGNRDSRPQAWAKNIVSVGGIEGSDTLSRSDDRWRRASIGPANDGRIKPDLSHFYGNIRTIADTGNGYTNFGGTSGSTPIVAGHFGLLFQMWSDGVFDGGPGKGRDVFASRPHATTAKALLINSAYQYTFKGSKHNLTRVHQGWGFPDVKNAYDAAKASNWRLPVLIDESAVLAPLQVHTYQLNADGNQPLKVTMVYADPRGNPGAKVQRINDLTLKVTSPSGVVYWGNYGLKVGNWSQSGGSANKIDTVENVFIQKPEQGNWKIEVLGDEIVKDAHVETPALDADYALVATGGTSNTQPGPTPTIAPTGVVPTPTLPPANDPVFVGAGDIADCNSRGDEATAKLLDQIDGTVFTLGDNAYNNGTVSDFRNCYNPTWGRHKARTYPSIGNHDYRTNQGGPYYDYFGNRAGQRGKGYYSYNLGAWHIVVLNSEINVSKGSEQEQWLRADLAANQNVCTLAYWHRPLFSSGRHGNDTKMRPLWDALYEYGADVVLSGHDHHYERFAPQDPRGRADSTKGIRTFVVGTGGRGLYGMGSTKPNSEVRNNKTWGVLKMTLHPTSYDWEFVPVAGKTFTDSGTATCVGADAVTPTPTTTPRPVVCSAPIWDGSRQYLVGDMVTHRSRQWRAQSQNQGQEPGASPSNIWQDLGACTNPNPSQGIKVFVPLATR